MTLEMDFGDLEPKDTWREIEFHRARMGTFENAAREFARDADDVVAEYVKQRGARSSDSIVLAGRAAREDVLYKDAIAQQQMYDRWTMREAAVVSALTGIALLEETRQENMRQRGQRLDFDTFAAMKGRLREYRMKIIQMFADKKDGKAPRK